MDLRGTQQVLDAFPETRIAVVMATKVRNTGASALLSELKVRTVEAVRTKLAAQALDEQPNILAWRETYRGFGVNPKRLRPSAEALARRVSRGGALPEISKLVDAYNVASLSHLLPVGAYDVAQLRGPVQLRMSPGGEPFQPLGEARPTETTLPGEVVYADRESVLTRCWNHRDGDRTKVTPQSTTVILLCEAAHPSIPTEEVRSCQALLRRLVEEMCGGRAEEHLLDRHQPQLHLDPAHEETGSVADQA
jgi:DNA/RNA-binding domain of Phe-tRNA-synthetase-like protein